MGIDGFTSVDHAAAMALASAPDRFIALGFSLGGWVALAMLRRAPERVAAVILISGNAFPDDADNALGRRATVGQAQESGMKSFIDASFPLLVGQRCKDNLPLHCLLVSMAEEIGHDGHRRQAEMNICRPDLLGVVDSTPSPVLLLAGSEDQLCPAQHYGRTAAGPNVRLSVVPGAGHFLPLEAPAEVALKITEFLAEAQL